MSGLIGEVKNLNEIGVIGESNQFEGVRGVSHAGGHGGVVGINDNNNSNPNNPAGPGVYGASKGTGVWGVSETWMGVYGNSKSTIGGAGVMGDAIGPGVIGKSQTWMGVYGETQSTTGGAGVWGEHKANGTGTVGKSVGGVGVLGVSDTNEGVHAETKSPTMAAIAAFNLAPNGTGAAVYAKKEGSIGHAGFFEGDVHVTRSVTVEGDVMLSNADCAEEFDVADPELAQPGTVMVIDEDGAAVPCVSPYDHRVIGVVSGAGDLRPALLLDRKGGAARRPIALMGKVFCRVDADQGAIRPGDLLTTSSTPGHAMRASDATHAPGTMIGKALATLDAGRGMIPILAILQ